MTPQFIFGVLLTSDNYNDEIERYKTGRNGYGIKLANIFASIFQISIGDPINKLEYIQRWQNGMTIVHPPEINPYNGPGYTQIMVVPDFPYFYQSPEIPPMFLNIMSDYYLNRTMECSFAAQVVTSFNGVSLDFRDANIYFNTHFDNMDPTRNVLRWKSTDGRQEFMVAETPNKGFVHAFVNGVPVNQGVHVNEYVTKIFEGFVQRFEKTNEGKKIRVDMLKKHISILLRVTLDKPAFDSQIKKKLEKPKPKVVLPSEFKTATAKWIKLEDEMKKLVGIKVKTEDKRLKLGKLKGVTDATQASSANWEERHKNRLIITEGKTGETLVSKGLAFLPGGLKYNGYFPMRGKVMNTSRHSEIKAEANKELSSIMRIIGAEKGVKYREDVKAFRSLRYRTIGIMVDADFDGSHIGALLIKFIIESLTDLAPFNFIYFIATPVIMARRGKKKISFYQQKQFYAWIKDSQIDIKDYKVKYYKGLGSHNTDEDTLKALFQHPTIISMQADPNARNMIELAFNPKFAKERKDWIRNYDPRIIIPLVNPRPITDFFMDELLEYSRAAVRRAIPSEMDGMKVVHRKILYAMFLKFHKGMKTKKESTLIKVLQFTGFVMEKSNYHHGDTSLHATIVVMGQCYITGPNNIPLFEKDGNFGDRLKRGKDASPGRYLSLGMAYITRFIYRIEDFPIQEYLYEDGQKVEPKEMYPIICMALINKCEGIGTAWSTKIYPHDPRVILKWQHMWLEEKKAKRHIPESELEINLLDKPELIPWYRDYHGRFVRVKTTPFESYHSIGEFEENSNVIRVTELPVETSLQAYKDWGEAHENHYLEDPENAILRTCNQYKEAPYVGFMITGMGNPTLEKLDLVKTVSLCNLNLLDQNDNVVTYNYTYEILASWMMKRLAIYVKRRLYLVNDLTIKYQVACLKYQFLCELINGTLVIAKRPEEHVKADMRLRGYPCGDGQKKKTKKKVADDEEDEDDETTADPGQVKDRHKGNFLLIPVKNMTVERAEKIRQEAVVIHEQLVFYQNVLEEDMWLKELSELSTAIDTLYRTKVY